MNDIQQLSGICAPIRVDNIDTDQIIPSREMTRVSKHGLGAGLFAGWRYLYDGKEKIGLNKDFVLVQPRYQGAAILLGGRNFGCGSSREHAVWALRDFGIKAVIAESFGRIFRNNCARNGLLAIELSPEQIDSLESQTASNPRDNIVSIDLTKCEVHAPDGTVYAFEIDESDRNMLLKGLDYIDFTLQFEKDIERFIARDRAERPWASI